MRCFLALLPDPNLAAAIDEWSIRNYPAEQHRTPMQNLHITLQFLGEIDDTQRRIVEQGLRDLHPKPFELWLNTVGYWPVSRVLWLGSVETPEPLLQLQRQARQLAQRAHIGTGGKRFHAHITLARRAGQYPQGAPSHSRRKRMSTPADAGAAMMPGPLLLPDFRMMVEEVVLQRSVLRPGGAVYDTLACSQSEA